MHQMNNDDFKKAVNILIGTYWSSAGWKKGAVTPEDFAYARSAGVMFDPISLSHAEIVQRAIRARNHLTPSRVADGFLASLASNRVELRSALGSYAVLRHFPDHNYSPEQGRCSICGEYLQNKDAEDEDLNVLNFERFKWGGVRHDQPLYASFDLEQFARIDKLCPSSTDVRIFHELIQSIKSVPPDTTAAALSKMLTTSGFKSNKAERDVIVGILGLCGILATVAHPGYFQRFVPASKRELPPRRFVDMHYPACWWRGSDGINEEALTFYFGHVL
jgi:hypothetical protein